MLDFWFHHFITTTSIRAKVIYIEMNMNKMVCIHGRNYNIWKSKMKDLLFVKKMHLHVFSSYKPENVTNENWEFEHRQVCGYIRQWVEDNVHNHILNDTQARTLWEKFKTFYVSKVGNNKLFLLKQLITFKYIQSYSWSYKWFSGYSWSTIRYGC